jgi:hypothetical protein
MSAIGFSEFKQIVKIWEEELGADGSALMPLAPLKPPPGNLLFVGLNPSFIADKVGQILTELPTDPETYFAWPNPTFDPSVDRILYQSGKERGPYFANFRKIAEALGVEWDHVDLFFWRETSQHQFRERMLVSGSHDALKPFGQQQLEISLRMIEEAKPICIVVANTLASDIYLKNRNPRFIPPRGCYEEDMDGRSVPLFLSSMLTGQRALDKHSLKRLVWHIGRELEKAVDFSKLPSPS